MGLRTVIAMNQVISTAEHLRADIEHPIAGLSNIRITVSLGVIVRKNKRKLFATVARDWIFRRIPLFRISPV